MSGMKVDGTITFKNMDGNLLAIAGASGEACKHGTAVVTGISNLDELGPSEIFFNPLPRFLFLLFLVNAAVASIGISAGTST
ncbi:hypothetical protein Scep_027789 [Stephania cephalantha]|uniref:Uncharacterized protein n=1 Tax=Stephania cephalantha TaxID=152367 RepID=A0AAP0HL50_9MAGN